MKRWLAGAAVSSTLAVAAKAAEALPEIMAVRIGRKFAYEDGKCIALDPGHDEVIFYELADPAKPTRAIRFVPKPYR
jgi:hypothetical protein